LTSYVTYRQIVRIFRAGMIDFEMQWTLSPRLSYFINVAPHSQFHIAFYSGKFDNLPHIIVGKGLC